MPIYSSGDEEITKFVAGVVTEFHPPLADAGLRVDILEARPKTDQLGEPVEDALKVNGYPAFATIKIRGPKDRGQGLGDVLLTVDAYRWPELDVPEQTAAIDHELTHLELCVTDGGAVKRDDYDRPKLRLRLHDHHYGWFDSVAKRHPISSIEVQQATYFVDKFSQIYLPGLAPKTAKRTKRKRRTASRN